MVRLKMKQKQAARGARTYALASTLLLWRQENPDKSTRQKHASARSGGARDPPANRTSDGLAAQCGVNERSAHAPVGATANNVDWSSGNVLAMSGEFMAFAASKYCIHDITINTGVPTPESNWMGP